MQREITLTADGSHTVSIPGRGLSYHSHHGALQESEHVFIRAGLETAAALFPAGPLRLFEMGFGTGLNALLTALWAAQAQREIQYTAVERFPLTAQEAAALNYPALLGTDAALLESLHGAAWDLDIAAAPFFTFRKLHTDLLALPPAPARYHLVYFDAFAPDAQPELWTEAVFSALCRDMEPGGVLTTYCSKGSVRRAMQAGGFRVEKVPGPPGKREMVRAFAGAVSG